MGRFSRIGFRDAELGDAWSGSKGTGLLLSIPMSSGFLAGAEDIVVALGQLGLAAATRSTVTVTGNEVTQSYAEVEASRCAHGRDSIPLQQSSQSSDNAADTYSPLMSPSPNDDSCLLVSGSMAGQDKIPQQGSQKSDPPHLESRRPLSELSPSKVPKRPLIPCSREFLDVVKALHPLYIPSMDLR